MGPLLHIHIYPSLGIFPSPSLHPLDTTRLTLCYLCFIGARNEFVIEISELSLAQIPNGNISGWGLKGRRIQLDIGFA